MRKKDFSLLLRKIHYCCHVRIVVFELYYIGIIMYHVLWLLCVSAFVTPFTHWRLKKHFCTNCLAFHKINVEEKLAVKYHDIYFRLVADPCLKKSFCCNICIHVHVYFSLTRKFNHSSVCTASHLGFSPTPLSV